MAHLSPRQRRFRHSCQRDRVRPRLELLEQRSLLATAAFQAPDLSDLIRAAQQGQVTVPQAYFRMVDALQNQLTAGPLADLNSGQSSSSDFVAAVEGMVNEFNQSIDAQIPTAHFLGARLKSQGARILAEVVAMDQENAVGLISDSQLGTQAQDAIAALNEWPAAEKDGLFFAVVDRTRSFEQDQQSLIASMDSSAASPLAIDQVATTLAAESLAYESYIAAYAFAHPFVSDFLDNATNDLAAQVAALAQNGSGNQQSQVAALVANFDSIVLGSNGLLGARGIIGHFFSGLDFRGGAGFPPSSTTPPTFTQPTSNPSTPPPPTQELGSITITEDTANGTAQVFNYQSTGLASNFALEDFVNTSGSTPTPNQANPTRTFSNLAAGTYTITQDAVTGWSTTVTCSSGGTADQASRTATVTLAPGANVTCTFTNQPPDAPTAFLLTPLAQEGQVMHIHPHLTIRINGQDQVIPANIGITANGLSPIHTHDATGKLHVESPQILAFRLKDFFTIWKNWSNNDPNIVFTATNILGHEVVDPNHQRITMTVDGVPSTDFGDLILKDLQNILISYETF